MAASNKKTGKPNVSENSSLPRQQLLDAAGQLMTERRSTDLSLAEIAERAGMSPALVKYYFGNKAGMMVDLLRSVLSPAIKQLAHLPAMDLPPEEKLRIHISGMARTYFRYPFVNQLMRQLLSEDPRTFGPLIADEFSKPVAAVQAAILDEGERTGTFRKVDRISFYFHVIGAYDQLFFGRCQLEHIFGIQEISDELIRTFIDHLHSTIIKGIEVKGSDI